MSSIDKIKKTDNQDKKQYDWLKNYQFKPGQSGNPKGRPKGSKSLKTFAREYLETLSDEEKLEFLSFLPPELVWRMSEGNPAQDTTVEGTISVIPLLGGDSHALLEDNSDRKAIEAEEAD